MIDLTAVKEEAEKEVREEQMKAAKEKVKCLLRKKEQAKQVLVNVERELADVYAELDQGLTS